MLLHKAIEVEVGARDGMDPHEVAQVAVGRVLDREDRFVEYWSELSASMRPDHFTVANLPTRLAHLKSDPWADLPELELHRALP